MNFDKLGRSLSFRRGFPSSRNTVIGTIGDFTSLFRLSPAPMMSRPAKTTAQTSQISGVTGKLHLDEHNRVHRELDWAQIKNGVPNTL